MRNIGFVNHTIFQAMFPGEHRAFDIWIVNFFVIDKNLVLPVWFGIFLYSLLTNYRTILKNFWSNVIEKIELTNHLPYQPINIECGDHPLVGSVRKSKCLYLKAIFVFLWSCVTELALEGMISNCFLHWWATANWKLLHWL